MADTKQEIQKVEQQVTEQLDKLREPMNDILDQARKYAVQNPESALLWCFGIGFVLGWKLKPW